MIVTLVEPADYVKSPALVRQDHWFTVRYDLSYAGTTLWYGDAFTEPTNVWCQKGINFSYFDKFLHGFCLYILLYLLQSVVLSFSMQESPLGHRPIAALVRDKQVNR